MKAIIVGDPHVGKSLSLGKASVGSGLNTRVQDQFRLLDWALEKCIEHNVFMLILTGDCFDSNKPDPMLMSLFLEWIHKCGDHNIEVHIVLGNHEILRVGAHIVSALDIIEKSGLSNVHIYKYIDTIHLDGASFTFLPFRDRKMMNVDTHTEAFNILRNQLVYENAMIPKHNLKVLVGHLTIQNAIYVGDEVDDVASELICPHDLFEDYDYVWNGHVHKPQVLQENPRLAHIGSMNISDYGEEDHVKIIVLFDTHNPNCFSEIPIPTVRLYRIRISVPTKEDSTQYVLNEIEQFNSKKPLKDSIIKLEIKLTSKDLKNVDREIISNYIYNLGTHNISNFTESKFIATIPVNQNTMTNDIDVPSAIKLWGDTIKFDDEEMKEAFLEEANEIYRLLLEGENK